MKFAILFLCALCLFLFCLTFVKSANIAIECPESAYANEGFTCTIDCENITKIYDFKMDFMYEDERISRIWNEAEDKWQSTNYYLDGIIEENKSYKIDFKIEKTLNDDVDVFIKLRNGSKIESFNFSIDMEIIKDIDETNDSEDATNKTNNNLENETGEADAEEEAEESMDLQLTTFENNLEKTKSNEKATDVSTINLDANPVPQKVINLNSQEISESSVIYESKNEKIKYYALYGLLFFLVLIIGLLLIEKW